MMGFGGAFAQSQGGEKLGYTDYLNNWLGAGGQSTQMDAGGFGQMGGGPGLGGIGSFAQQQQAASGVPAIGDIGGMGGLPQGGMGAGMGVYSPQGNMGGFGTAMSGGFPHQGGMGAMGGMGSYAQQMGGMGPQQAGGFANAFSGQGSPYQPNIMQTPGQLGSSPGRSAEILNLIAQLYGGSGQSNNYLNMRNYSPQGMSSMMG